MTTTSASPLPVGQCAVEECTAITDGTCMRGHDSPLDCEEFELQPEPEAAPGGVPVDTRLRLPHGLALQPHELGAVLRYDTAVRVAPLGTIEAGKTTLFSVLFEFLAARRLDGWTYAGSVTTLGFAERSHDATVRSGRSTAATPRTSGAAGDRVLHISARSTADDARRTLLLADVSGEHVEALMREGRCEGALAEAVRPADHLLLLVDGARAADPQLRHNAVRHVVDIAHVLAELPVARRARLAVVLTKRDYFPNDDAADAVVADAVNGVEAVRGTTPERFTVAARPDPDSGVEPGHGLRDLFEYLVEPLPTGVDAVFSVPGATPTTAVLRRVWGKQ